MHKDESSRLNSTTCRAETLGTEWHWLRSHRGTEPFSEDRTGLDQGKSQVLARKKIRIKSVCIVEVSFSFCNLNNSYRIFCHRMDCIIQIIYKILLLMI